MFKTALLHLFLLLSSTLIYAQSADTFVLRGNVKNLKENAFEIGISGYFLPGSEFIPVDSKGDFSETISIDGIQDIRIAFNEKEMLQFFVLPNDTINLNWDQNDAKKSLKISSPSKVRSSELNLMISYYKRRFSAFIAMYGEIDKPEVTEAIKYKMINNSFHADIAIFKNLPRTKYTSKIIKDCYYNHVALLARMKLLDKYKLDIDNLGKEVLSSQSISPEQLDYKVMDESFFHQSYIYRQLIFSQMEANNQPQASLENLYDLGQQFSKYPGIKDWYLTKTLFDGLYRNNLKNVSPLYQQFLKECKNPDYIATLTALYDKTEKLNSGKQAPLFTLTDNNGKSVSLTDFKGKVVILDFWGVYCPPCRLDILNYSQKVHQKYADKNVVFINICIDEKAEKWKKAIQQLNLTGINLIAEGHRNNVVVKAYNVTGIPHYVVIDAAGNLISNKKIRLSNLANENSNIIDHLLTK